MTSEDGAPVKPPPSMAAGASVTLPTASTLKSMSPLASANASTVLPASSPRSSLLYRRSSASLSTLFASTSTPPTSRPVSPKRGPSPARAVSDGPFSPNVSNGPTYLAPYRGGSNDARNLILRSFVPHIAVHVSPDTDEIARQKGFRGGFRELLRPFGEIIHGKVTVRDSVGLSRSWEDFGVRFVGLGDGSGDPAAALNQLSSSDRESTNGSKADSQSTYTSNTPALRTGGDLGLVENLVEQHLSYAEMISDEMPERDEVESPASTGSPFYHLFLRKMISGLPLSPHETYAHPVACIIAISSGNEAPIEALRQLYDSSSRGEKRLPAWINAEYLRYYVLVHDEEGDDIAKSTALFEAMKRHFGLHCHLLRIRSSRCVPTDDDSVQVPTCECISAAEELAEIQKQEVLDGVEDSTPYLVESDMSAIRTFVREMVTQSVVPFMERCVTTWNDQVASRRRGISGRFMSLSKKWTGFGSSRSTSSTGLAGSTASNSNFDALQGFYRPDAPEATMRKLADYAFMLRDWKLAQETYDVLRADFNNDKAWMHHAGANEMAALSTLLMGQTMSSRVRSETVDQLLETAAYSYLTRCSAPYGAVRCLALGVELLKLRGGSAADDAAKWGTRMLEVKVLGSVGNALVTERVAACYSVRKGSGSGLWGARLRKASLWNMLAADAWLRHDKPSQAARCLDAATALHGRLARADGQLPFREMQLFLDELQHVLQVRFAARGRGGGPDAAVDQEPAIVVEEEREKLDSNRSHRKSLIGAAAAPYGSIDAGSLSPTRLGSEEPSALESSFQ